MFATYMASVAGLYEARNELNGECARSAWIGEAALAKKRKVGDDESEASSGSEEEFIRKAPRSSNLKRSSADLDTAETSSRKRGRSSTSKKKPADFEIVQSSGAKRKSRDGEPEESESGRQLRSRVVLETTILKEKRSFRDQANYIYPSTSGERSAEARKGMGDDVTRDLMDRGPRDPFTPSVARSVEPLKEGEKPALKKRGVSRNHILADSRIRVMLEKIATGNKATALKSAGPERNCSGDSSRPSAERKLAGGNWRDSSRHWVPENRLPETKSSMKSREVVRILDSDMPISIRSFPTNSIRSSLTDASIQEAWKSAMR